MLQCIKDYNACIRFAHSRKPSDGQFSSPTSARCSQQVCSSNIKRGALKPKQRNIYAGIRSKFLTNIHLKIIIEINPPYSVEHNQENVTTLSNISHILCTKIIFEGRQHVEILKSTFVKSYELISTPNKTISSTFLFLCPGRKRDSISRFNHDIINHIMSEQLLARLAVHLHATKNIKHSEQRLQVRIV